MNAKELLSCKYCNEVFKQPITLNCCGRNICKQHIEELINENSTNKFSCPMCLQENTNQNFHCNEIIEKLIESELNKFKLDPKYEATMNNFKMEIQNLEAIIKDPENIIYEEIRELKRQVDLDREKLKYEIDTQADGLIQQLESYEKRFKYEYKASINLEKYNQLVESSRKQLNDFEKCLNSFSVDNKARDEKNSEIEKKTTILQPEIEEIKSELFLKFRILYIPVELERDGIFGNLKIEKTKPKKQKEFFGNQKKELFSQTSYVFALLKLDNGDLVSGCGDGEIQIWDTNNETIKKTLIGHTKIITDLKVVPNNHLTSASEDKTIKIWNLIDGTLNKTLTGHTYAVMHLAILPNGDLASASLDKTIKIWDINEGTVKRTLTGHSKQVLAIVVLNNGDLASGSLDSTIIIWDADARTIKRTLRGHTSAVYSLIMLENGDLVSGSYDKTIKIWNTEVGTVRRTLTGHTDFVFTLKELDNGDLVSASYDKTVKIWNVHDGSLKKSITVNSSIYSLEVLENGDLVSGCGNGTIKIWE